MKSISYCFAVVSVALVGASSFAAATASPAQARHVKTVDGQSYWTGDPGRIDPGSYWTSGLYKYDPNGYMESSRNDQLHEMTIYADHAGKENCVFRERVAVTNWEFSHPYVRVCRVPERG
jgi:hypothetical protein